jgi:hypothetical protein
MKKILIVSIALAVAACGTTSGRLGELPTVANGARGAKVVAARVSSFVGAANGYTVAVDGKDLFGIGSGEHTEFLVPEGEHYIAVKCFGGWTPTWKEESLKFSAQASDNSYFSISPSGKCAEIKPATEAEAKKLLQGSKFVSLEKPIGK